ncbi:MAG TPA: hypothetical protein VK492_10920 [Chitinophagaceae bacterium]|nr:hypothetical protein [Chitinophagaceae bacterium]
MRTLLTLTIFFLLTSCNNSATDQSGKEQADTTKQQQALVDTTGKSEITLTKFSVLVLPPFDVIANEGISPDIQKILEKTISNDTTLALIKFPYQQLMNVPYQNVFDKKYCKPITDKLQTDIILMTKLEQATRTGQITRDRWSFQIKIYNTKTEKQFLSLVTGDKLTSADIESLIKSKRQDLFTEIKDIR